MLSIILPVRCVVLAAFHSDPRLQKRESDFLFLRSRLLWRTPGSSLRWEQRKGCRNDSETAGIGLLVAGGAIGGIIRPAMLMAMRRPMGTPGAIHDGWLCMAFSAGHAERAGVTQRDTAEYSRPNPAPTECVLAGAQPEGGSMPAAFGFVVNDRGEILLIQRGYGRSKNLAFGLDKRVIGNGRPRTREAEGCITRVPGCPGRALPSSSTTRTKCVLVQRSGGSRAGKWSLPGGNAADGRSRRDAAVRETRSATGIEFVPGRLCYENRHRAQIWLGRPRLPFPRPTRARWFSHDRLPEEDSLGFGIDVRTMERWAAENDGNSRISCA